MKAFKFKIEDCINLSRLIWIKGENHFQAMNLARNMFPPKTYKITFTGDENNIKFS